MKESLEFNKHYLGYALPLAGLLLAPDGTDRERFRREFLHELRHWPDFFHFRKGRDGGGSATEPLLAILGSLCGLRPGKRAWISESEELRFQFLFSCASPPGASTSVKKNDNRKTAWDDFLRKILQQDMNRPPTCEELESEEAELDGLLDELDVLAAKAEEILDSQTRDQFRDWCYWVRNPDDRERPPLPEMPPGFWEREGYGGRNRFLEKLPWLRQRKKRISDQLGPAIEEQGGIRCETVVIERVLGTYSFQSRLITLYPRMMRLVLPSLLEGLPFTCFVDGHEDYIRCLAVLPDGRLASGSYDKTIRIWDVDTLLSIVLTGHEDDVNCLAVLPDGRLASGSDDKTIRIWELTTGNSEVLQWNNPVRKLVLLKDGRLAAGGPNNTCVVWDILTGGSSMLSEGTLENSMKPAHKVVIMFPDGGLTIVIKDDTIYGWNRQTGQLTAILGNNAYEALKTVVEIHEAAHALWHVGLDAGGRTWGDPAAASGVLHEIIAQYYTKELCLRLDRDNEGDRCQLLHAMFENLTKTSPQEYRLHERLNGIDGEEVRAFFLSFRQSGPQLTWDGLWNSVLETIATLLPFLRRHLSPVDSLAAEEYARRIASGTFNTDEALAILDGIGRLPVLRQAVETAIRVSFPSREEAVLLCLAKVCKLSPASGSSLPFTLDAARKALRLEKPRIEPVLLNHPVVRSLCDKPADAGEKKQTTTTLGDVWPGKLRPDRHNRQKRQ